MGIKAYLGPALGGSILARKAQGNSWVCGDGCGRRQEAMGELESSVGEGSLEDITSIHLYLMTFYQLGPSSKISGSQTS